MRFSALLTAQSHFGSFWEGKAIFGEISTDFSYFQRKKNFSDVFFFLHFFKYLESSTLPS